MSPGRVIWEPYEGQEYVVFIDESFYRFFDFTRQDGNFVHGAVGVPSSHYDAFKVAVDEASAEYRESYKIAKGRDPDELKSGELYKMKFGVRRRLSLKLRAALEAHGGVIAGFYTSNRGYVMERLRVDLIADGNIVAVPDDHHDLFSGKGQKLNETVTGPGMSGLISRLLFLPVISLANFFSSIGCDFRIVYDPRQAEEDVAVQTTIEGLMATITQVEQLNIKAKFLGLQIDKRSHEETGLQVADLIAGEVRRFFRFNPHLLTAGSDLRLIRFNHEEGETVLLDEVNGKLMKKGRQVAIPRQVLRKALESDEDCCLAYLRRLFAAGLVTCITEFGTERDVSLFDGCFLDLCD